MTTSGGQQPRRPPGEHELAQVEHASDALRQLLAAASAPPSTAELKGRARAIAAFRAAYRLRRPGAGGQPPSSTSAAGPAGTPAQPDTDSPARTDPPPDGRTGDEGRTPAGSRRRSKLARARRWSAAQLTVTGAALLMVLGATAGTAAG